MKVRMLAWIPGTRPGGAWPQPGEELEVSDAEAAGLVASGLALAVKPRHTPIKVAEETSPNNH